MYSRRYDAYGDYSGGYDSVSAGPGQKYDFEMYDDYGDMQGPSYGPPGPSEPYSYPPPRGRFMRNPVDDRVIKYLTRCGVSKTMLKDIPRHLLNLFEPQYCGLCGLNFDSFDMSRIHYVSKNHTKNVKKWSTPSNNRSMFSRERPIKSRAMYCELCDVELTSKVHAESHYDGKSHRAVVEGRKAPKNPVLLRPGMERRLGQLIRREKKFLNENKPAADSVPAPKEEASKKAPANTSPDLYCDICKTHVTCSEQMTMHLNGKRHLAKEKQYILKTMRGEAGAPIDDGEGENFAEENEAEEGDGDQAKEDGGKDDEVWEESWD